MHYTIIGREVLVRLGTVVQNREEYEAAINDVGLIPILNETAVREENSILKEQLLIYQDERRKYFVEMQTARQVADSITDENKRLTARVQELEQQLKMERERLAEYDGHVADVPNGIMIDHGIFT